MSVEGRTVSKTGWLGLGLTLVALGLLVRFNPMSSVVHGDGYYTYLWARSIVFDRNVDFADDYALCPDPWGMADMPHGVAMNQWSPGAALFFAPILAFDVLTQHPALTSADPHVALGCIGPLAERAAHGSVFAGILLAWLSFLIARRAGTDGTAALATFAVMLGGPIVYYVTTMLSYGHAASGALSGLAVWTWVRERTSGKAPSLQGYAATGLALGLAMLARPQNVVLGLLPLWSWIEAAPLRALFERRAVRPMLAHLGRALALLFAVALGFGLQPYQWWSSYGEFFMVPQGDYYLRPSSPRIANLLFSSANGLFLWCPIAYVAVGGLALRARREGPRGLGWPLLVVLLVSTYLNACVADWWGAAGFAARRFDAMTAPFALGVASALTELKARWTTSPRTPAHALGVLVIALLTGFGAASSAAVGAGLRSDLAGDSGERWSHVGGRVAAGVSSLLGNPLAWPASIPFALRHGVHPRLWDHASMPELFFHRWLTLDAQPDLTTADLVGRHAELAVGFDPPRAGDAFRSPTGDRARVLLPVSYPFIGALRLRLEGRPDGVEPVRLSLALDEESLGEHEVRRGESVLEVRIARPHEGLVTLYLAMERGRIGLASVEFVDRSPPPREAQARHNRRLRARRDAWRRARGLLP